MYGAIPCKFSRSEGIVPFYRQDYKIEVIDDLCIDPVIDDVIDAEDQWLLPHPKLGFLTLILVESITISRM